MKYFLDGIMKRLFFFTDQTVEKTVFLMDCEWLKNRTEEGP